MNSETLTLGRLMARFPLWSIRPVASGIGWTAHRGGSRIYAPSLDALNGQLAEIATRLADAELAITSARTADAGFRAEAGEYLADLSGPGRGSLAPPDFGSWAWRLSDAVRVLLGLLPGPDPDAGKLDAVRAVLARFNWETDDRQYALEQIDLAVAQPSASAAGPGAAASLTRGDLLLVLGSLDDAAAARFESADGFCSDCSELAAGAACDLHANDARLAAAYKALSRRLGDDR